MRWSDIAFTPTSKTLRQFAGLWIIFFAWLAWWQGLARERTLLALLLIGLAFTVGPAGLLKPGLMRPIYLGWMMLAFPVGWTLSRLVLGCLFYGVFTPIGLFFRLIRRDALARRHRPELASYWTPKPAAPDVNRYFRQF